MLTSYISSAKKELGCIKDSTTGTLLLSGEIDYRNGKVLYEQSKQIIEQSKLSHLLLDCSGVVKTSSVGLSLILSLIREANKQGKTLVLKTLSVDLEEIAKFSGVFDLLPLDESFHIVQKLEVR